MVACSSQDKGAETETSASVDSAEIFLALFSDMNSKDMHVYTPCDTTNGKMFDGKQIDSSFYHFFSFNKLFKKIMNNIIESNRTSQAEYHNNHYNIFSCFKFPISEENTGLLVRWPSQYSETAIYLFVWDNKNKRIIEQKELADAFGDEGWYFVQDAWIKDLNKDDHLDIITRIKDYDLDLDDTTKVATVTDSLFVYLAKEQTFLKTKFPVDTNLYKILDWKEN